MTEKCKQKPTVTAVGKNTRCHPDSNRRIKVLQTFALPLGYGTNKNGAVDGTRTRDIHLGKVALYQLSYYRIRETGETVRTKRLELLRLSTPDPKSGASAIPPRPQKTSGATTEESDPLEIRTPDTLIKSQVLCQLS